MRLPDPRVARLHTVLERLIKTNLMDQDMGNEWGVFLVDAGSKCMFSIVRSLVATTDTSSVP